MQKVGQVSAADDNGLNLTQLILSDPVLADRVLRAANGSLYERFGQDIQTVTQAVVVLGYKMVGHLSMSLSLVRGLATAASKVDDLRAHGVISSASLASTVSRHMSMQKYAHRTEEAGLVTLLNGLGRCFIMCYMPQVWDRVESVSLADGISEEAALAKVTGLTSAEIGKAISLRWGIPDSLSYAFKLGVDATEDDAQRWIRQLTAVALEVSSRLADAGFSWDSALLDKFAQEYGARLGLSPAEFKFSLEQALVAETHAPLLKGLVPESHRGKVPKSLEGLEMVAALLRHEAAKHSLRALTGKVMEALSDAFGARRVVLLLKDSDSSLMSARFVIGDCTPQMLAAFKIDSRASSNVFSVALESNAPALLRDPKVLRVGGKLPAEYLKVVKDDPAFLLLPMVLESKPVGLFYLDWPPGAYPPDVFSDERALLIEIRDLLGDVLLSRRTKPA